MERTFLVAVFILAPAVWKLWQCGRRQSGLPPGPPTVPVLGNALQFPKEYPHLRFAQWAREYGEIFSVKIFNMTIVVVSSPLAVKEVLDKQGVLTGNRPRSHFARRVTDGLILALEDMQTNAWARGRKAIHTFLTPKAVENYLPVQQVEYLQLLHDILETPQDLYTHIKRTVSSVMITLVYGKRCPQFKGTEAETYFEGIKRLNEVLDPGAHPPVDLFPLLKYVPSRWAPWKSLCDSAKVLRDGLYSSLLSECERRLDAGNETGCFIEKVLKNQEKIGLNRDEIKGLGAVMIDAGAETTTSFLQSVVLAFLTYPECQRRAQEEIDRVVGADRLPSVEDFEQLVYLQAFVKEVHRFRPLLPIALPHVSLEDVTYNGYLIPKGSTIFMNIYGIFHDPNLYDEPESFKPERYLESEFGTKAKVMPSGFRQNFVFGAGRRICPGENMAQRSISLNAMNLLWAFEFTRDSSGTGNMDFESYAKPGLELAPSPFTCNSRIRSEKKAAVIREEFARAFPK